MEQTAFRIDTVALGFRAAVMDFHSVGEAFRAAVIPLLSFAGLVHLWITLPSLVFLGTWRRDQGGVDDCALLHGLATGLEVGFHRLKNLLAKVVSFQQVPE